VADGANTFGTMQINDAGSYTDFISTSDPAVSWNTGDVLSASAPGDVVGPFSGSVVAVEDISGLTPPISSAATLNVSVSQPFVITWNPTTTGKVETELVVSDPSNTYVGALLCFVDASLGNLAIPTSDLANFQAGDHGDLVVVPEAQNAASSPSANADVELYYVGLGGNGNVDIVP
jgi:hypothetical protein